MAINLHVLIMQFICSPLPLHSKSEIGGSILQYFLAFQSHLHRQLVEVMHIFPRINTHIPLPIPQCPVPSTDDIDEDAQWSIFTTAVLLMSPSHISSVSDGDGHHLLTNQSALIRPPFSRPSFQSRSTNCLFMN